MRTISRAVIGLGLVILAINGSPALAKTIDAGQGTSKMQRMELKGERKREDRLFKQQRKEQRRIQKEEDKAFRHRNRMMHAVSFQRPTNFGQQRSALAHRQNAERRLFFNQQREQRKLQHARGRDRRALALQQHQDRRAFLMQQRAERIAIRPHH